MIAQVVPILRLRRDTTWWSYRIPPRLHCLPGSLVVVQFRGRVTLGIIWSIEDSNGKADLDISEVLTVQPLIRTPLRHFIEYISDYGLCSLSTALYIWLPSGLRAFPLSASARRLLKLQSTREVTLASLQDFPQHLVLLPQKRAETSMSLQQKFKTLFTDLFATTTPDIELERWFSILNGSTRVGLGRERALFAPWLSLKKITVFDPEDISYFHEQIPYCNLLKFADNLGTQFSTTVTNKSALPIVASPPVIIIDLSTSTILDTVVVSMIRETLLREETVLILYNAHDRISVRTREGREERIVLPGIETIGRKLATLLGLPDLPPQLVLGTRSIFEKTYSNVGLTIALSLDPLLQQTIFADQLHGLADIGHLLKYNAPCIVQAHHKEHPILHALRNNQLNEYLQQLIELQQANHLPPFSQHIVCSLPGTDPEGSSLALHNLLEPLIRPPWSLGYPFDATWRKKPFRHVLLHADSPSERLPIAIRTILVQLPRPWRVQHNPWYLV